MIKRIDIGKQFEPGQLLKELLAASPAFVVEREGERRSLLQLSHDAGGVTLSVEDEAPDREIKDEKGKVIQVVKDPAPDWLKEARAAARRALSDEAAIDAVVKAHVPVARPAPPNVANLLANVRSKKASPIGDWRNAVDEMLEALAKGYRL